MYTKTDYTRTKYGQYKDDNSKILTMLTYYVAQHILALFEDGLTVDKGEPLTFYGIYRRKLT